jgi:hypothetical protein
MHYVMNFTTSKFDVTKEDENDINPIYGQSLLLWLKERVKDTVVIGQPDTEDWGWYAYADWKGRRYLLGASTEDANKENGEYFWFFQVIYHRSFREWLLGRGKGKEDKCVQFFKSVLASEPEFHNVTIDW